MLPDMGDLRQIQLKFLFGLQNAEAFSKGLHHSILDPIMDHFDKMTGTMWADVPPAFIWRWSQSLEDWPHLFHYITLATDHQAISFRQASFADACTRDDKVYAFVFKHLCVAD